MILGFAAYLAGEPHRMLAECVFFPRFDRWLTCTRCHRSILRFAAHILPTRFLRFYTHPFKGEFVEAVQEVFPIPVTVGLAFRPSTRTKVLTILIRKNCHDCC